ncbi:hypothetical protein EJ05DRAFT_488517 [Pseudovirgaria hyperparasitica]|uniref:Myb-like domain-containing protein n=1 Tax=Pseudovirgaria hyperparasitica TaxID=470096 RepID=A0A6A6VYX1_9PEZI|nr:uncharacterized protein EJ05DRAFT_488517 [Pseudovirgaria hyperparasitica]KAF2754944.1 hypothetical protein EJ05DRAFT_488517 [Pseudovirgaria hyperparasitica]
MNHHGPSIVSPISEVPTLRARKTASTGGNRSWSEEEENYLLQTRMQKMPYKHIAIHLKKTELACRLHFHQLSHGSHRRKRAASISSYTSSSSTEQSPYLGQHHYPEQTDSVIESRQSSPIIYNTTPSQSIHTSPARRTSSHQHKTLLPKPSPPTPRHSPDRERGAQGLRINTSDSMLRQTSPSDSAVDTTRLRALYDARRASFWASIAADYGQNISPAHLEHIWQSTTNPARPPTPEPSPDGSLLTRPELKPAFVYSTEQHRGFTPVNQYQYHSQTHQTHPVAASEGRPQYTLPLPQPQTKSQPQSQPSAPALSRSWSGSSNVPIAALLTSDREPRHE